MGQWFDASQGLSRQLASTFVASGRCEPAVFDLLLGVRLSAPASKVPAALRAIRINFEDALNNFAEREESQRDGKWQRACVLQHIRT